MEFFIFWKTNLGFEFRRRSDDCITGKVGLYNRYIDKPGELEKLCNGTHDVYKRIEKSNYKDGKYIGIREGAYPSRQYRNCPDQQPPPLKRVYDKKN